MTYSCLVIISNDNDLKFGFARDQKIFWRYRRHILRLLADSYIEITRAISTLRLIQLTLSGTLSLEVTNMPGTAKVLGSNLIRACFFFSNEVFRSKKKLSAYYVSAYFLSNTPWTAKVLGSNLIRACFFFQTGSIPF